jgi:ribonuclease T1
MPPSRSVTGCGLVWILVLGALLGCAPPAVQAPEGEAVTEQVPDPGHQRSPAPRHESRERRRSEREREATEARVPDKVLRVLRHIDEHHRAPDGYEGGRTFRNLGRDGEESLPRTDARGRPITYREWDVNRRMPGVNRGAERLVTGSDGSAYFTADHYRTFTKIR